MFALRVDKEIVLHPVHQRNAASLHELTQQNRQHLLAHVEWPLYIYSEEIWQAFIRRMREQQAHNQALQLLISYQGAVAGCISLSIHSEQQGEIGYWLGRDFTHKGIISRAARALVDYAFLELRMHRIIIQCATNNPASAAVPQRLGFHLDCVQRQAAYLHQIPQDIAVYSMLEDDWRFTIEQPVFNLPVMEDIDLRLFELRHARLLYEVMEESRPHLNQWEPWVDTLTNPTETRRFIQRSLNRYIDGRGFAAGIWQQGEPGVAARLIGGMSFRIDAAFDAVELGYWLSSDYTGRGIVTSSARALVNYAFSVLQLHRAVIQAAQQNVKSWAVAERLGFTRDCIKREDIWLRDRFIDRVYYSLLDGEWQPDKIGV